MTEEELKQAEELMNAVKDAITEEVKKSLNVFKPKNKCPVCEGRGQVPASFYYSYEHSTSGMLLHPTKCRSCGGTGVI